VAAVRWRQSCQQRRLARVERAVAGSRERGGGERLRRRVRERQAGVPGREDEPGRRRDGAGAVPVDQRSRHGGGRHRDPGDQSDGEAGSSHAEPAAVVQVDDLEGQDGAVAQHVEEDPGLDEPQLAGKPQAQPDRGAPAVLGCGPAAPLPHRSLPARAPALIFVIVQSYV
jgi:hypothetical protein